MSVAAEGPKDVLVGGGVMYSVVAVFVNKANVNRGSTDIWFMFKVELWFWVRLPSF